MNGRVFGRLVWKEYRSQRAFWISMVVIAMAVHLCVLAYARDPDAQARTLLEVALALSALYALGCGATLFATEHETETYDFQRALPVSARRLFFSKITWAVASTLVMIGVQWLLAAMLGGWRPLGLRVYREIWGSWGFGAVELLVWGTFFSLLLKQPLKAAILAVLTASVTVHLIVAPFGAQYMRPPYVDALPFRGVFIAIVAAATVWMGFRWFRERLFPAGRGAVPCPDVGATAESAGAMHALSRARRRVFGRLLWQHLYQSAGMLALLTAMVVPLFLVAVFVNIYVPIVGRFPAARSNLNFLFALAAFMALLAAPLAGACVFLGDQRRRGFRFLAERGVAARSLWLSRQLIWGAVPLLFAVVLLAGFTVPLLRIASPGVPLDRAAPELLQFIGGVLGFVLLAYAAGQLCSMFFASSILALFFSLALTAGLCYWAGLMAFLGVPWSWSAAPIPLVLLLATWLRAPHWLLERNTLRAWMPTTLVLALPAIAIVAGVCAHRVYSVPLVDPGFDPQGYASPDTPEARETREMYRRALEMYLDKPFQPPKPEEGAVEPSTSREAAPGAPPSDRGTGVSPVTEPPTGPGSPTPTEKALVEQNQGAIRLALQAGQRPSCSWFERTAWKHHWTNLESLGSLLITSARRLQAQGDLDAALEHYLAALRLSARLRQGSSQMHVGRILEQQVYEYLPFWAAHPDQTAERIRAAIDQLEAVQQEIPSPCDAIKAKYVRLAGILDGRIDPRTYRDIERDPGYRFIAALTWLPWEAGRARRVLNLFTARDLAYCPQVESAVRTGQPPSFPDPPDLDPQWQAHQRTTPWIQFFYGLAEAWPVSGEFIAMEMRRRAVRLQMALAGWKAEHGELPERLEPLVGPFLKRLPVDPYTQKPFEYFPEGLPAPEAPESQGPEQPGAVPREAVPPGKPFFQAPEPSRSPYYPRQERSVFEIPVDD